MKRIFFALLILGFISQINSLDLLWTGYYYNTVRPIEGENLSTEEILTGGTFYNRINFTLNFDPLDLSLRLLLTDKRLLPLEADDGRAGFNPGFGIYHHGSGSRFLYGILNEYGLSARVNNIWQRSIPYMESRSPSSRDLKAEPSNRDVDQAYLFLALPQTVPFNAFFSIGLDNTEAQEILYPAYTGGIGFSLVKVNFNLEAYYTNKLLPERKISTWFSSTVPLPERELNFYALGFRMDTTQFAFASDLAYSEVFAWGNDLYVNFALRLGNRPWRLSVSGDGAGNRFVDRSGSSIGESFRLGARLEHFWVRAGLFRARVLFRSPGLDEIFNRFYFSLYYRPSAPTAVERRAQSFPIRFTRASMSFNRDARVQDAVLDTYDALFAYTFGPLSGNISINLRTNNEDMESFKLSGEAGIKPGLFDIIFRLSNTYRIEKDPILEMSLNISFRPGRWGRIGLRINSTDFPERWNYTLSWRYNYSG